jgi:hypothetical protein
MNIVRKSNEQRHFDEVRAGEIFEYCDSIYIKSGGGLLLVVIHIMQSVLKMA